MACTSPRVRTDPTHSLSARSPTREKVASDRLETERPCWCTLVRHLTFLTNQFGKLRTSIFIFLIGKISDCVFFSQVRCHRPYILKTIFITSSGFLLIVLCSTQSHFLSIKLRISNRVLWEENKITWKSCVEEINKDKGEMKKKK